MSRPRQRNARGRSAPRHARPRVWRARRAQYRGARNSQQSELVRRISSQDADERMPPANSTRQLSNAKIAMLKAWVDEGVK
ncbi:MAG: hypothetical protein H6823_02665 [Planctomycetaceae bacterium]|nr:hypothetical protein [Planctomycetaceae bacterium]